MTIPQTTSKLPPLFTPPKEDFPTIQEIKSNPSLITKKDLDNRTLIHQLTSKNTLKNYELLSFIFTTNINKEVVNEEDDDGWTPLLIACSAIKGRENNHPTKEDFDELKTIKLLIKNGANLKATNSSGNNCLFYAVSKGNLNLIKFLLNENVEFCLNKLGMSVFHRCCLKGDFAVFKLLVEHFKEKGEGSNMGEGEDGLEKLGRLCEIRDREGNSCLHYAFEVECVEIVDYLLAVLKVRDDVRNKDGKLYYEMSSNEKLRKNYPK